ncbi:hypothetical protein C8R44DRAFT_888359 [Mycena epipterygia]|nr:hypothetical protein C8R44DRAFT_888359 [Mycena epipterygia]
MTTSTQPHTVALLASSGMGSKMSARLFASGAGTILTSVRHDSIRDGCSTTRSAGAEAGASALVVDASLSKELVEVGQIPPESRYGLLCARADPRRVGDPRWRAFEEGKDTDTAGDESIGRHPGASPTILPPHLLSTPFP